MPRSVRSCRTAVTGGEPPGGLSTSRGRPCNLGHPLLRSEVECSRGEVRWSRPIWPEPIVAIHRNRAITSADRSRKSSGSTGISQP